MQGLAPLPIICRPCRGSLLAAAAHAAEISLNHVVMKFHRSDFTDDTVGDFTARISGAHLKKPAAAPAAGNIPHCALFIVHCLVS